MDWKKFRKIIRKNDIDFTLFDIGASGEIHQPFKKIMPFSKLVRFDPDLREMKIVKKSGNGEVVTINKAIVPNKNIDEVTFYLTRSPFCSSTLRPNNEMISRFHYAELFEVIDTTKVPTTTLNNVLDIVGLNCIDWLKLDTQGTDLRILKSLNSKIFEKLMVCEIEPGFYDHYHDSDTFEEVHKYMVENGFWLADLNLQKQVRIRSKFYKKIANDKKTNLHRKILSNNLKRNPTAAEALYIRSVESAKDLKYNLPELLKLWVCSICTGNIEFAYDIISSLEEERSSKKIVALMQFTERQIINRSYKNLPNSILKKIENKFF